MNYNPESRTASSGMEGRGARGGSHPPAARTRGNESREGPEEAGTDSARLEVICKLRCSLAADHARAREALSRVLTFYTLADYYRDLLTRMGFGDEVNAMRVAWQSSG